MKQQVNLYQPMFRRQEKKVSAKKLLGLLAGAAVLFIAVYAYLRWDVYTLETQLADLKKQNQAELRRVGELSKQYPLQRKSATVEKQLASLRRERQAKQNLIALLQGKSTLGNDKGFSGHMEGISRQHIEGMWVTAFAFNEGGTQIGIEGSSIRAELVPQFIQRLSDEASFNGAEFRVFKMQRDEKKRAAINFQLKTRQNAGAAQQ